TASSAGQSATSDHRSCERDGSQRRRHGTETTARPGNAPILFSRCLGRRTRRNRLDPCRSNRKTRCHGVDTIGADSYPAIRHAVVASVAPIAVSPSASPPAGASILIGGVLFDFGGTLDADGIPWKTRFFHLCRAEGLTADPERFDPAFYAADDALVGTI